MIKASDFNNPRIRKNKYYLALILALLNIFSTLIREGKLDIRICIVLFLSIAVNILCFYYVDDYDAKKYKLILYPLNFATFILVPFFVIFLFSFDKFYSNNWFYIVFQLMVYIYSMYITIVNFAYILIDILKSKQTNFETIIGAFAGYLWLGIIASYLIVIMYGINPHNYKIPVGISFNAGTSLYFAYDAITTFGFSDITPNTDILRIITILLAIIGQFYTIVIIGIILNKYFSVTTSSNNDSH